MYAQGAKAKMSYSHKTVEDVVEGLAQEIPSVAREIDDSELASAPAKLPNAEEIQKMFDDPVVKSRLRTQLAGPLTRELESLVQMVLCQHLGSIDSEFSKKLSNLLVNWENKAAAHGTEKSQVYATSPQYKDFSDDAKRTLAQNYATNHTSLVEEIQKFYRATYLPTVAAPQPPIEGVTP
jgi:hypothetical protein